MTEEYEFGNWIDTKPKTAKRAYVKKEIAPVAVAEVKILSNACMLEHHNACSGVVFSYNRHGYVACECDCGVCAKFHEEVGIQETIAIHNAWRKYCEGLAYSPMEIEFDAYKAAWIAAKRYYND